MPDGCTYFFDGDWRHCCDAHDAAYASHTVSAWSHVDLGLCVAQTSGGPVLGAFMAAATLLWWIFKNKGKR